MTPFVDPAEGRAMLALLTLAMIALALLAAWLIESGLDRRRFWVARLAIGFPVAGYVIAVGLALAVA